MSMLVVLVALAMASEGWEGRAAVIDGDSLIVAGVEVRLHGVDAPEWDQTCWNAAGHAWPCGRRVAQALAGWLRGKDVACRAVDTDPYGRTVAKCFVGAADVGAALVRAGGAVAYVRFTEDYVADEAFARDRLRGVWSGPFDPPAAWRALSGDEKARRVRDVEAALARDPSGRSVTPLR